MAAGTIALAGMAISAASQGIAAGRARKMANGIRSDAQAAIDGMNVPAVVNPYENVEDLSYLAEDLSGQMYNPYSNLGVATRAAEMQTQEADVALANTLDTLRSTGASAGGATALAQAALKSKQGVSATIEKQEAENERLRAQGQAMLQDAQIKEQMRLQGVQLSEGARVQDAEAKGKAFQFQAEENRYGNELNYYRSLQNFGMRQGMQSMADQWGALGAFGAGVGQAGAAGMFDGMGAPRVG
jgi:hypothetical protein